MDRIFSKDGVLYPATIPLSWHKEPELFVEDLAVWMYGNVTLLRALATIEALQPEKEIDQGSGMGKALERLEFKIDLALNLVAKLLTQNTTLPPACNVLMSSVGLEWACKKTPVEGEEILIHAYISPKLPQPLILPARVTAVRPEGDGARVYATFTHLSEEVQDWLSRTVFRYHRRSIHRHHE
jgi:hypothetical protein